MTQIIGGHNFGLLDGSYSTLNRNDQTGRGIIGHGQAAFANVSNGNLVLQERDIFLPSFGQDFNWVRTYNSRAVTATAGGWSFWPNVFLSKHNDTLASGAVVTDYSVVYGDGTELEFNFNAARNLWVSTDGASAFETLQVQSNGNYLISRADRTQYLFDKNYVLQS